MHPLNHVVTHIHRVGVGGHDFHAKSIFVARCLKCLVPPTGPFDQSRTDRFGRAAIDVVDDWFHGFADRCRRIFLLQAMMIDVVLDDGLADRRREIHVLNSEVAGARIVFARMKARTGQFDKRNVFAHGDGVSHRRNRTHQRPGFTVSDERQSRFNFRVLREIPGAGEIESTARGVQTKLALLHSLQRSGNSMHVAQIEIRGIDQGASALFRRDFKSPHRRFGEGVFHRTSLVSIVAVCAIAFVRRNQQHARPDALESHDMRLAHLSAIQTDIVRSDSRRQRFDVEKF